MPVGIGERYQVGITRASRTEIQCVSRKIKLLAATGPARAIAFGKDMSLTPTQRVTLDPRHDGKVRRTKIQRPRIGQCHRIVHAIKRQAITILPGLPRRPINQRRRVAIARKVR